ncbi:hypothetical protein RRG08_037562 [Elysia crispata]|uniref:Uncharacterized protein n=1 Tax=Elysia crispata TaxID=231223 RepID=A0AAE0Y5Y9_9GAST|nr:hypothetical protein RRG08_037562 [Elysia crispata]
MTFMLDDGCNHLVLNGTVTIQAPASRSGHQEMSGNVTPGAASGSGLKMIFSLERRKKTKVKERSVTDLQAYFEVTVPVPDQVGPSWSLPGYPSH